MLRLTVWAYRRSRLAYRRRHPEALGWCALTPTCSTYAAELLRERRGPMVYWLVAKRIYWDCLRATRATESG
jgi:hypothetical protein